MSDNTPDQLLENNRRWAHRTTEQDPHFFEQLSTQQAPRYLWIGCADSRVPATQIVDLKPGGIFVHRNIANVVLPSDLNALSVIQYAVDVLKVPHILVVGHYGCGGVKAVVEQQRAGLVDNWLRHVGDVAAKHAALLQPISDMAQRHERLCELNAIEQAVNVCHTTIVQDAWERGQDLSVHAWIYGLTDGRIHDLELDVSSREAIDSAHGSAIGKLQKRMRARAST